MVDLVINHCSSKNKLFKNFLENKSPGKEFLLIVRKISRIKKNSKAQKF